MLAIHFIIGTQQCLIPIILQMEDFKKYCLNDREVMENEIIHLRNDSKVLRKKVIKLLK